MMTLLALTGTIMLAHGWLSSFAQHKHTSEPSAERVEAERGTRSGAVGLTPGGSPRSRGGTRRESNEEARLNGNGPEVNPTRPQFDSGDLITVRVVDRHGAPAAIREMTLGLASPLGTRIDSSSPAHGGVSHFPLGIGEHFGPVYIVVSPSDATQPEYLFGPFQSIPESKSFALTIEVGKRLYTIAGRVSDASGNAVPGELVVASPWNRRDLGCHRGYGPEARTDSDGRFVIDRLPKGRYHIAACHSKLPSNYYEASVPTPVEGGADNVVILVQPKAIFEIVAENHAGEPVRGSVSLRSTWTDATGRSHGRRTHATLKRGRARLPHTTRSTQAAHQLIVTPLGATNRECTTTVLDDWTPQSETIRLTRTYPVQGSVFTADGRPLRGAQVRAGSKKAITDNLGAFSLGYAIAGEMTLEVVPEGMNVPASIGGNCNVSVSVPLVSDSLRLSLDPLLRIQVTVDEWSRLVRQGPVSEKDEPHDLLLIDESSNEVARLPLLSATVTFLGVQDGASYTVAGYGLPGERYILKRGIRAGTTLHVTPKRGVMLSCKPAYPDELEHRGGTHATLELPGDRFGKAAHQGAVTVFRGVPPGTWKLSLSDAFMHSLDYGFMEGAARAKTESLTLVPMAIKEPTEAPPLLYASEQPTPNDDGLPNRAASPTIPNPPEALPVPR